MARKRARGGGARSGDLDQGEFNIAGSEDPTHMYIPNGQHQCLAIYPEVFRSISL